MPIVPLYDNIVVQLAETEKVTEGGIHIPEKVRAKDQIVATIIAVGEGKLLSSGEVVPLKIEPGEQVVLDQFSGTKFSHEGEEYTAVSIDDVLVVLR